MTTNDPRQLIVLCDGTNNTLTGGTHDTNLVKLLEHLRAQPKDPHKIIFYDPGVGSTGSLPAVTWFDEVKQGTQRLIGLALGGGIYENMAQSYAFLMRNYREGDQIYFFGFSRGAFTARSVAGLVNQFGLLQPQMEHMIPTLVQLYFSKRNHSLGAQKVEDVVGQIKQNLANASSREVEIQYVGVWDTVASVGIWPMDLKMTSKPTVQGKHFLNVRHAMALDEHRAQFKVRPYLDDNTTDTFKYQSKSGKPVSLIQQWFPGSHCDVGGGNDKSQTTLSNLALDWLVDEAIGCGLRLAPINSAAASPAETRPIHSQIYASPIWAITGLHQRDANHMQVDKQTSNPFAETTYPLHPVAHENALYNDFSFAKSTPWILMRSIRPALAALLVMVLAYVMMRFASPRWALVINFLWIGGYAYILG